MRDDHTEDKENDFAPATSSSDWVEAAEIFPNINVYPIDADLTPIQAFVIYKSVDADGEYSWGYRSTPSPNREELLGALCVQEAYFERRLLGEWESSE